MPWWGPSWLCAGRLNRSQDLRRQFPGDDSLQISHEAIYLSLYDPRRRHAIDRNLTQRLRSARPMRRPKIARRPTGRVIIRGMVSINACPAEVENRKVPGHWEGDLVMGIRPSAVATLVERTSRYTAIVALPDGIKAEQVTPHLTRSLLDIPPQLRRTLTWDRGREMAEHQAITAETGLPIYLCKPRSPWQRGTNENAYWCSLGGPASFDGRGPVGPLGDSENTCQKAFR
ncbi:IS30 family transposase [Streptomyces violaceusniger]|uniref:IS30 family transposase n=1 Tax=Streptomyces violaceusniger TaxID=68280 RepID=UPI0038284699